jgi:hypothetical protein
LNLLGRIFVDIHIDIRVKIAAALLAAFLAGDYEATVRARRKRQNIIDYYEDELRKKTLYASAMEWAKDNALRLSPEELKSGIQQRLLWMRVNTNGR